jgi:hypothetical protein
VRIAGEWQTRTVTVDGRPLDPQPSQQVSNHSPDGFAWGYAGSGPAQLALAILLHYGLHPRRATWLHQALKADLIQGLPQADFAVTFDLDRWLAENRRR